MLDELKIVLGLIGLWLGTECVLRAAVNIAHYHRLSELFIGLAILSIGSDLPELAVAVGAGIDNLNGLPTSGVVVGSSLGSAFGQFGLVMGIAGMTGYLTLGRKFAIRHGVVLLGSIVLLFITAWDANISRMEGWLLLVVFTMYLLSLLSEEGIFEQQRRRSPNSVIGQWLLLVFGMSVVIFSSELTVSGAIAVATRWNVDQTLIAILIVGVGTSLPELSVSIAALAKKKAALSVGNLIGSNIFDTLVPIGVAASIAPLTFKPELLVFDLPALFLLSALVLIFFMRKKGLQKPEAITLLIFYGLYSVSKIFVL